MSVVHDASSRIRVRLAKKSTKNQLIVHAAMGELNLEFKIRGGSLVDDSDLGEQLVSAALAGRCEGQAHQLVSAVRDASQQGLLRALDGERTAELIGVIARAVMSRPRSASSATA